MLTVDMPTLEVDVGLFLGGCCPVTGGQHQGVEAHWALRPACIHLLNLVLKFLVTLQQQQEAQESDAVM